MQLQICNIRDFLEKSLIEDLGINGDITSAWVVEPDVEVKFQLSAREDLVLCGEPVARFFLENHSNATYKTHYKDAEHVSKGQAILSGQALARDIFKIERVMLNFLQHMSGIATEAAQYVQQVKGTRAKIYDTRKTIPMMRHLQKYAVTCGGGHNHRCALDQAIMIKDNHIAACGGNITEAIKKARVHAPHYIKIEVECDNLEQVKLAADSGADIIMLDNMTIEQMHQAVDIINKRAIIEASGGVSLATVREIAQSGVDVISVGKLTHSVKASDISLDIL